MSTAAERVRAIAVHLRKDAERLTALRRFLREINERAVTDALGLYEEGYTAGLLRSAIAEAIVISCMRCWDKPTGDRYSAPAAAQLLRDASVFREVASRGSAGALKQFCDTAAVLSADVLSGRLRRLRDSVVAHHLPELMKAIPKEERPMWSELDSFASDVLLAIEQLSAGTGIASVSIEAGDTVWTGRVAAFLHRLIGGPAGRQMVRGGP
jgi:hypothetical protein